MIERRTIDELVIRYRLEPLLKDVYVEGPRDKAFVEWIAAKANLVGVKAYEVGTVDVPTACVQAHGQESSNRGRVVALALELERRSADALYRQVACVADADLTRVVGACPEGRLLVFTDYTSGELYLFSEDVVRKLLSLALSRADLRASDVLDAITPMLQELFLVRLAARTLKINLAPVPFQRSCTIDGRNHLFDLDDYLVRYVCREGHAGKESKLREQIARLRQLLIGDRRHFIHGHDFVAVMHWYLSKVHRVGGIPDVTFFDRMLWACLEYEHLSGSALLEELISRFGDGEVDENSRAA